MNYRMTFNDFSIAWTFHRNTCRWMHNAESSENQDDVPEPGMEYPDMPFVELPPPTHIGSSLRSLVEMRCSCRDFSAAASTQEDISSVLFYALGIWGTDYWGSSEFQERPVPSGGGMYPLDLYLISNNIADTEPGVYHYLPIAHGLEQLREVKLPKDFLRYLFMGQYPVTQAAAILIIAADTRRSLKKYGDRGYRYLLLEAGHIAQNINLTCCGLGLQSLNLGGFLDDELSQICCLSSNENILLYAIAIGQSQPSAKHHMRFPD